ncbi:MAG TPA: hypothetical protein VHC97_04415 [Thermoanaerobaculia bacterium]|jgi:hypothetical protein|nr:hypothetical protein [Thermoanaerobaculia bacterium]HEX3129047.1 hypothetical protein [Thermoanaerobaculia bacterium]
MAGDARIDQEALQELIRSGLLNANTTVGEMARLAERLESAGGPGSTSRLIWFFIVKDKYCMWESEKKA